MVNFTVIRLVRAGVAERHRHSAVGSGDGSAHPGALHPRADGGQGAVQALPAAGTGTRRFFRQTHRRLHYPPRAPEGGNQP